MSAVPGRAKILASSVVFIVASIVLLAELICLPGTGYIKTPSFDFLNWCGVVQGLGWFLGFALLIDWIVFDTYPVWGPSRRALVGATLKLIASAFFCVQPFSAVLKYAPKQLPAGVPWANFVGILFFHTGNCIDAVGSLPLFNKAEPISVGNLPVYGILTYCASTWVLVIGDGFAFTANAPPYGAGRPMAGYVGPANVIGSLGLLLGSILYTWWAACAGRGKTVNMPDEPLVVNQQP